MSSTSSARRVLALGASLLLTVPMLLASAPGATATSLESCSTDEADYPNGNHLTMDNNSGHFEMWWKFNTAVDPYCVLVHIKDTTGVTDNCFGGMMDFVNTNGHYDDRQFISCDQGSLKVVSYKDNEAGKQYNTGISAFGNCVRIGGPFGAFNTPCDWKNGYNGGSVDDGSGGPARWPRSPNSRSDFITWGGGGSMTCYDEGATINCDNFANV
jgi:hypothetical protein